MRSVLGRWCLLIVVGIGVVAMHHVPFKHDLASGSARHGGAMSLSSAHHMPVEDVSRFPVVVEAHGPPSGTASDDQADTGHGPLHLCLAILLAAALLVVSFVLLTVIPPVPSLWRRRGRMGTPRIRPPPSMRRRLALLCVFRL